MKTTDQIAAEAAMQLRREHHIAESDIGPAEIIIKAAIDEAWRDIQQLREQLAAARAAIRDIRDEAVTLVDARNFPNSVLHIESPQRIKKKANTAIKGNPAALDAAIAEATKPLVDALKRLRDCDFTITLPDRMDAVRKIAGDALAQAKVAAVKEGTSGG